MYYTVQGTTVLVQQPVYTQSAPQIVHIASSHALVCFLMFILRFVSIRCDFFWFKGLKAQMFENKF